MVLKWGCLQMVRLFDKWDMFETLVNNMTWVRISVDAGTKETYNGVYEEPGVNKTGTRWYLIYQNSLKPIKDWEIKLILEWGMLYPQIHIAR